MILPFVLSRQVAHLIQHIFNEDPVARGGVVHKDMSHSAHQLAVLNDRTAGHECVKADTTLFSGDLQPIFTKKCSL